MVAGLFASVASVLLAAPLAFQTVELPKRPIEPYGAVHAHGACAVITSTYHFGFMGISTDDGASFRFLRLPGELLSGGDSTHVRFTCWAGRFFVLTGSNRVLRLEQDGWQVASEAHQTPERSARGFVSAGSRLYVGGGTGFVQSSDAGRTFLPTLVGVSAVASDETIVLAAKGVEVHAVDGSDQLTLLSKLPKRILMLGFAASSWYATIEGGALYRSDDQGKSWKREAGAPSGVLTVSSQGTTLVANLESSAWFRDPKGGWRKVADARRVEPGASGFWIETGGGPLFRAPGLTVPRTKVSWPENAMPSIRLLAAHGASIVVATNYASELLVSRNAGQTWTVACERTDFETAALDGEKLQLSSRSFYQLGDCRLPGFKTRVVPKLPDETCNGDLCVRFRPASLHRSRDRGKSWEDLSASLGQGEPIVAAAAAGREILIARGFKPDPRIYRIRDYRQVLRSVDDGKTFTPFSLPESITTFAPSARGWLVGTTLHGLVLVPFASSAKAPPRK